MSKRAKYHVLDSGRFVAPDTILFEEQQALPMARFAIIFATITLGFFGTVLAFLHWDIGAMVGLAVFACFETALLLWLRTAVLVTQVEGRCVRIGAQHAPSERKTKKMINPVVVSLDQLASLRAGNWESLGGRQILGFGQGPTAESQVYSAMSERAVRLDFKDGRVVFIGSSRADRLRAAIESAAPGRI